MRDCQEAAPVYAELRGEQTGTVAHPSAEAMEEKKSIAHKTLDELKGRFIKRDINFMGARKVLLCISAALVVLSFVVVGVRGLQFGIEFVGGTSIAFHNTGDTSIEDMRTAFAELASRRCCSDHQFRWLRWLLGSHYHHVCRICRNHGSESGRHAQPEHR